MRIILCALALVIAAPAQAEGLPKAMLGAWSTDPADCANRSSELRMTVGPKNIDMYEVGFAIKRVTRAPDGYVRVSGYSSTDDGGGWETRHLKLLADGTLQTGKPPEHQIFHRCPKDGR
jgi:hypothetical protein